MSVSMMALYRRPDGGEAALATFRRRYAEEHLPLIRSLPGLRALRVHRVTHAFDETDLVMVAEMVFDSRAELDAALASPEMRAAGRNLREIAPGHLHGRRAGGRRPIGDPARVTAARRPSDRPVHRRGPSRDRAHRSGRTS